LKEEKSMSNFCTKCGAKLGQSQNFCTGCGANVNANVGQGVSQNQAQSSNQNLNLNSSQNLYQSTNQSSNQIPYQSVNGTTTYHSARQKSISPKKIFTSVLVFIASIALIFIGIRSMNLAVFGSETVASIVSTRQATQRNVDGPPDPRLLDVNYEFFIGGVRYTGSTTQIFPRGITQNTTIPVKYIANAPRKNAAAADAKVFNGIALLGLGIVLIFVSFIIPFKKSKS